MGIGIAMYAQDYDETFPLHGCTWNWGYNAGAAESCWVSQIHPYVKNTQIFSCPSSPGLGVTPGGSGSAYGNNLCVFSRASVKLAQIYKPAELIHVSDAQAGYCSAHPSAVGNANGCPYRTQLIPASKRHGDGANVLYNDGHVKWLAVNNLLSTTQWQNIP